MKLDPAMLEREIQSLIAAYPELADDEDLRASMVEGSTEAFDVLARCVAQEAEAKAMSAALAARMDDIKIRVSRFEKRREAMRDLIFRVMSAADLRKAELPEATLSIRPGTAKVIVSNEDDLPDDFFRVTRSVDKAAIRDALKAGKFVPGAELSNGEPSLSIRVL
jgi:hypothetical protein